MDTSLLVTSTNNDMLRQRLIVAIILIPLGVMLIMAENWVFASVAAILLGYAAWEFWRIFHKGGYHPSAAVLVLGVGASVFVRMFNDWTYNALVLALAVLAAMTLQVIQYERGSESASLDFNITLGGVLYLGWLGSFFVSVHNLPHGAWWLMVALPACWIGDGAAYFVGSHFGKHKMSPRVSPKKTWEGYLGGIIFGALGTLLLAALWSIRIPEITPMRGLILGMCVAVISPLGDLGESMLKRGFGIKDSGTLLPGHGGVLDRIDSWLWASAIAYFIILWLF